MEKTYDEQRMIKVKDRIAEAMRGSVHAYTFGRKTVSAVRVEDSTWGGIYLIRKWVDYSMIELTYVCEDLAYIDTGDALANFSTEYFDINHVAMLIMDTIDMHEKQNNE